MNWDNKDESTPHSSVFGKISLKFEGSLRAFIQLFPLSLKCAIKLSMGLIVQKFGGTSVGTPERILSVAKRIARFHAEGHKLVVVVSAMGHTTDELIDLAHQVSKTPTHREMDMLLTAGERISMALLSMALADCKVPARSFTGSQSGSSCQKWKPAS